MITGNSVSVLRRLLWLGYLTGHLNLDAPEIYPKEGGWVEVEWSTENRSVSIELCDDGSAALTRVENQNIKQELDEIAPNDFDCHVSEAFAWLVEDAFDWDAISDIG